MGQEPRYRSHQVMLATANLRLANRQIFQRQWTVLIRWLHGTQPSLGRLTLTHLKSFAPAPCRKERRGWLRASYTAEGFQAKARARSVLFDGIGFILWVGMTRGACAREPGAVGSCLQGSSNQTEERATVATPRRCTRGFASCSCSRLVLCVAVRC